GSIRTGVERYLERELAGELINHVFRIAAGSRKHDGTGERRMHGRQLLGKEAERAGFGSEPFLAPLLQLIHPTADGGSVAELELGSFENQVATGRQEPLHT